MKSKDHLSTVYLESKIQFEIFVANEQKTLTKSESDKWIQKTGFLIFSLATFTLFRLGS